MTTKQIKSAAQAAAESGSIEKMRSTLLEIAEQMQKNLDAQKTRTQASKHNPCKTTYKLSRDKNTYRHHPGKEADITRGRDENDRSFFAAANSVFDSLKYENDAIATEILSGGKNW